MIRDNIHKTMINYYLWQLDIFPSHLDGSNYVMYCLIKVITSLPLSLNHAGKGITGQMVCTCA
jgi:hypothetical protein